MNYLFKKIFLILLTIFAFGFSTTFAMEQSSNNQLVNIEYYWGDGCSHCAELEPWLNDFEKKYNNKIKLNKHEIFKDKIEAKGFSQIMNLYGVPSQEQGTPTIIVNNKVLIGSTNIKNDLEKNTLNAINNLQKTNKNDEKDSDNLNSLLGTVDNDSNNNDNNNDLNNRTNDFNNNNNNKTLDSSSFKAIFLAALVDSINPCAIMVLIILLSSLLIYQKKNKKRIIYTAISFILAVYITYFSIGFGFTSILATANISKIITIIVGAIAILIGFLNIKDAFFYRVGNWAIEIPEKWRNKLTKTILAATSPTGAFIAGVTVTFFELPCTGGPYLFGISLISTTTFLEQIILLAFYNLIFISPLVFIAILVIKGVLSVEKAEKIRNDNVKLMHFITGIIMIIIGTWAVFLK